MARGRMIDKVIILSKKINAVSEGAENLYYRIYVSTDDFGLFHADPKILKGQIYTLRNISTATIEKRLNELIEIGLVKIYENNGEKYLEIVDFEKHQTFRKDYVRKHEYPTPNTKSYEVVRSRTESPTNINKSKLNKNKIKKTKISTSARNEKRSALPISFDFDKRKWLNITIEDKSGWLAAYPACDIELELYGMREWLLANPEKRKKNYRRFITNWLSRTQDKGGSEKFKRAPSGRPMTRKDERKKKIEDWVNKPKEEK